MKTLLNEIDEKEYALDIINKQMSDENRKSIIKRVKESRVT